MAVSFTLVFVDDPKEVRDPAVSAVAALGEPTRRRLYDHVVRQSAAVSRDDAAAALGLAREHTRTVCGMNLHLLRGVLHGLGERAYTACLSPAPGRCCVRLEPVA